MRAVSHLFIARSRAAIVWFMVTVGTVVGSAAYVQMRIENLRSLPQYVIVGGSSLFYVDPYHNAEDINTLHADQTRLAMETIYNRGPDGLDHQARLYALFAPDVIETVNHTIVEPEVVLFRDRHAHQKVEILGGIQVTPSVGAGEATTVAKAQVLRTSVDGGRVVNTIFNVKVFFEWTLNPNLSDRALFPTQCKSVEFFSAIQIFP